MVSGIYGARNGGRSFNLPERINAIIRYILINKLPLIPNTYPVFNVAGNNA
jgi:hypothetical protein